MRFDVRLVLFFLLVWVNLVRLDIDFDPDFQEDGESEYRLEYAHTVFKHKKGGEGRLLRGRFTPKIEKNFTFEGWVRREQKNPTLSKKSPQGYKTLACKWNKTRSGVWDERDTNWALIIDDYGFLHFFMGNGLVSTFGLRVRHITPLELGVWSHVAVSMEYTPAGLPSQAKLYLNGLYTPGLWKGPGKEQGVNSNLYIGNILGDTSHDNKEWYAAFDVARYWSTAKPPEEVAITRRLTSDNFYPNTADSLVGYFTWERANATTWQELFEEEKKEKRDDVKEKEKANEAELKKKEQEEKEKQEKEEKERKEREEKEQLERAERERKEKAEQERKEREKELLAGKAGPRKLNWPVVPHNPLRFTNPTCTSPEKPIGCSLNVPPRHCVRRTEYCHQTNQCPSSESPFVCGRQCISDISECPPGCAPGFYSCYDGTCSPDLLGCPAIPQCPLSRPKRCYGQCLPLGERCVAPSAPCEKPNDIVCPLDGQCKSKEDCEDTPFNGCPRVECADGRCVDDESKCTFGCPEGELRCFDGTCARICDHQPPRRRHPLEIEVTLTPQLLLSGQVKLDSWTLTATGGYVNSHQAADLLDIKLPAGVFAEVVGDKQNKFIVRSVPDSFLFKLKTAAKNHLNKGFASPVFYLGLEQLKKTSLNHLIEYSFIDAYLHENKTAQDYCLGSLNPQTIRFECAADVEVVSSRGNIVKLKAKANAINTYFAIIPKEFIFVADGGEDPSVIPTAAQQSAPAETESKQTEPTENQQPEATKQKRVEPEEQPQSNEAQKTEAESSSSTASSSSSTSPEISPLALKLELLEQKLSKYGLNIPLAFGGLLVTALLLTLLANCICFGGGKKDKKDEKKKKK